MTGSRRPEQQPIEVRLDELLDALNSGNSTAVHEDPELQGLAALARSIRSDDDLEWPDDGFANRLVDSVLADLPLTGTGSSANGMYRASTYAGWDVSDGPSASMSIPTTVPGDFVDGPDRRFTIRRMAQIAATFVGFGLLTLVLVTVFRGYDDEEPAAVGGDVGMASHPPQLAVAMLPDPLNANPDIYLISPDGSDQVNLTNSPDADSMPTWSPDGHQLAFISAAPSSQEALYVMDADGRNLRELYAPALEENLHLRHVAWSPDGRSIALLRFSKSSLPDPLSDVIVVDVGSGEWHSVALGPEYPSPAYYGMPTWSPDSKWLLFEAIGEQESRLFVADASEPKNGSNAFAVVADTQGKGPSWATTGEIAIADENEIRVVEFNPETVSFDELRRITLDEPGSISRLAWSPDGSQLVFSLSDIGDSSLWIASRDGSAITEIPDSLSGVYPAWSTDGSQIGFLRHSNISIYAPQVISHELVVYDVAGGSVVSTFPVNSPQEPLIGTPVWRPGEIVEQDGIEAVPTATPESIEPTPIATLEDPNVEEGGAQPALTIRPGSMTCGEVFRIEAQGFPEDAPVTITVSDIVTGDTNHIGITPQAGPTGEFTMEFPMTFMYPQCESSAARPAGLRLGIEMTASDSDGNSVFASALVTVYADGPEESGADEDDPRVQKAIQQVRNFLREPDATFTAITIDEFSEATTSVHLSRSVAGAEGSNRTTDDFTVEVANDAAFIAILNSNTAIAKTSSPIGVDEAREIAKDFYAEHDLFDDSLIVIDERSNVYFGSNERRYDRTWQLEVEGVRLPTIVQVSISLETGLVVGYTRMNYPYDGPLAPEVTEEKARHSAEQIIAEDPEFADATISETRLEVWYSGPDDTIEGRTAAADPEMDWRLAWTFTLIDLPGPEIDHILLIDALTGEKLEPQV